MRTAEKKLIERNLDLLFEFEKYVLEHPEITEKIPRDAVVFMKVAGDEKFNLWSERQAKKQAKKGAPLISVTVKKLGPVHSRIEGLALEPEHRKAVYPEQWRDGFYPGRSYHRIKLRRIYSNHRVMEKAGGD